MEKEKKKNRDMGGKEQKDPEFPGPDFNQSVSVCFNEKDGKMGCLK